MNPHLDKNHAIVCLLVEAQCAIADMPMGGIGSVGPTQEDINEAEAAGNTIENDAAYHQGQKAWLILERAKALLINTGGDAPTADEIQRLRDDYKNLLGQVVQARDGFGVYRDSPSMAEAIEAGEIYFFGAERSR